MATIFVNSLLYIWPISALIYGETGNVPIVAIVAWDAAIIFAFFVISTDLLVHKSASVAMSVKRLARNPVLLTIMFAIQFNLSGLTLIAPVKTALEFLSAGTAAVTLFALGVILSATSLVPSKTVTLLSAVKLFGLPVLVAGLLGFGDWPQQWVQSAHPERGRAIRGDGLCDRNAVWGESGADCPCDHLDIGVVFIHPGLAGLNPACKKNRSIREILVVELVQSGV